MSQEIKCFVIDGVTFIGICEAGKQPHAVAAVGSQNSPKGKQLMVSALSPFMDPRFSPEFPQAALDRTLVTFTPSESVLLTYGKFQQSLIEILDIPEGEPTGTEEVPAVEEGSD